MFVLKNSNIVYYDVDETLINWSLPVGATFAAKVEFTEQGCTQVTYYNSFVVKSLINNHKSGKAIVVWSAAGYEHAYAVVKALELEPFVDAIMGKPTFIYDDLPASEFMPESFRLDLDPITGKNKVNNGLS